MHNAKLLILILATLMLACSKPADTLNTQSSRGAEQKKAGASFHTYKDPKKRFDIQDVVFSADRIEATGTIEKLPNKLKPSDPARSKAVVLELKLVSEKDDLSEIKSSEFSLVYQADGKDNRVPCVGLSMGDSDMWGLAENGETSVFVRAKPAQKQKLLFLLPSDVREAALQHNQSSGEPAIIKEAIPLGKS
jgi:hypothetical protein